MKYYELIPVDSLFSCLLSSRSSSCDVFAFNSDIGNGDDNCLLTDSSGVRFSELTFLADLPTVTSGYQTCTDQTFGGMQFGTSNILFDLKLKGYILKDSSN